LIFLDPDHVRTYNNKIYYENVIKNRTLTKQRKDDMDINDSSNLNLISTIDKEKKYQINNQRPNRDGFEEGEFYQKLCRQNGTEVKFKSIYVCLNLFYSLVKSKTTSKIILSLSS
jgi:hypothetical protein